MTAFPIEKTPLIIPGIVRWYDASTTTTGAVSSWAGSANNIAATQGSGIDQPMSTASGIGNKQSVNFVSNDYLTMASSLALTGQFTMFCVNNTDTTNANRFWLGSGNNAITNKIGMSATNAFFIRVINGGSSDTTQAYAAGNNILTIQRDAADKVDMSFNNAAFTRLFSDAAQSGTSTFSTIGIDSAVGSGDWNGDIGDIIIYSRALSAAEIIQVNRFLSNKYGIAIS